MNQFLFSESQRFRQPFIWIVLVGLFFFELYGFFRQVLYGIPFGDNPVSIPVFVLILLFYVGIMVVIFLFRLDVDVSDKLRFRFFPLHFSFREIDIAELKSFELIDYRPIIDFGGWGIRYSFKLKTRAFTVSGSRGVLLVFKDGKKILLGSNNADDLFLALEKLKSVKSLHQ